MARVGVHASATLQNIYTQKNDMHSKMQILVSIKINCIVVKLIVYLLVARESAGNWIVNVDAYIY